MKANADAAWRNRRPADEIKSADSIAPAGPNILSQTAASAVAVVLNFADGELALIFEGKTEPTPRSRPDGAASAVGFRGIT